MAVQADPVQLTPQAMRAWMQRLLNRAERVGATGEIPVAAVLLDEAGRCIGHGSNRRECLNDPLGHAELMALRQGAWLLGDWRMNHCTLMVTLEPCPMCAQAISFARIRRLYFGASDEKGGGVENGAIVFNAKSCHHKPEVYGDIKSAAAAALLKSFFKDRR